MEIPAWSKMSQLPVEQAKYERATFNRLFIEMLFKTAGSIVLRDSTNEKADGKNVLKEIFASSSNGILLTSNAKRRSASYSIISTDLPPASVYEFQGDYLYEEPHVCWKAVERDLNHPLTKISFCAINNPICNSAKSLFFGTLEKHKQGLALTEEVRQVADDSPKGFGLTIALGSASTYFCFFTEGQINGVMVNIATRGGSKTAFSGDLTLLGFERGFNNEVYMEVYLLSRDATQSP